MNENKSPLYGGRHRRVLDHPDHRNGVNHGTMTLTNISDLAPSVVRLTATVDHEGDRDRWRVTNPAIRLELPDVTSTDTVSRVYTVRSCHIDDDEIAIEVDIVRHAGISPVMQWLEHATVGTSVRILGPRPHFCPPFVNGVPVGLFADETAIPALATILRDWPDGHPGEAWVQTPDEAVVTDLPQPESVTVHWIRRPATLEPGTTGSLVAAALEFSTAHPAGVTVWACGEHDEMRCIRDHFRRERAMTRAEVEVFGYWRRHLTSSEIDEARLRRYERELERNPRMTVLDDFDVED